MRRSELVNTNDFYKEYNKREEEIRKENYGLVTRFQQERKEESQREKEKDLILIDKIDNIISAFEDGKDDKDKRVDYAHNYGRIKRNKKNERTAIRRKI